MILIRFLHLESLRDYKGTAQGSGGGHADSLLE